MSKWTWNFTLRDEKGGTYDCIKAKNAFDKLPNDNISISYAKKNKLLWSKSLTFGSWKLGESFYSFLLDPLI